MSNTLQQGVKSLIQWITKVSLRRILIFIVGVLFGNTTVYGQSDSILKEEIKVFVFMSIEMDGSYKYNIEKWDGLLPVLKNHYDNLQVEVSDVYSFVLPNSRDTIGDGYTLQLFKIACDNSRNQSRYLLRYDGFEGVLWLRVAGYVENDMKVFFDYMITKGARRRDLNRIVEAWENAASLFKEIDFKCLLNGYKKNRTSSDCFVAVSYVDRIDSSVGFDPIRKNDVYAVFSRIPLYDGVFISVK